MVPEAPTCHGAAGLVPQLLSQRSEAREPTRLEPVLHSKRSPTTTNSEKLSTNPESTPPHSNEIEPTHSNKDPVQPKNKNR